MNRIKQVLKEKGIKAGWLAPQIPRTKKQLSLYCQNKTQPDLPVLARIANILKVDVNELIEKE